MKHFLLMKCTDIGSVAGQPRVHEADRLEVVLETIQGDIVITTDVHAAGEAITVDLLLDRGQGHHREEMSIDIALTETAKLKMIDDRMRLIEDDR